MKKILEKAWDAFGAVTNAIGKGTLLGCALLPAIYVVRWLWREDG